MHLGILNWGFVFFFFRTHLMCLNSGEEYMETFMGKYFFSIRKVEKKKCIYINDIYKSLKGHLQYDFHQ